MKKIIFTVLIIFFLLYFFADLTNESNYCIEDGDCKIGDVVYINSNEKVTINKENCLKYGWEWLEKEIPAK